MTTFVFTRFYHRVFENCRVDQFQLQWCVMKSFHGGTVNTMMMIIVVGNCGKSHLTHALVSRNQEAGVWRNQMI